MKTKIFADYKSKISTGSSIHVSQNDLPLQVNQMIVWMMTHPGAALEMVPRWIELKEAVQAYEEGSAKNHGVQP